VLLPGDNLPEGSLERVEVIMALEEAFDIEIPDGEAKRNAPCKMRSTTCVARKAGT